MRQAYTGLIYADQLVSHGLSLFFVCWFVIKSISHFEEGLLRLRRQSRSIPAISPRC